MREVSLYYSPALEHTHQWPHLEKRSRAKSAYDHLASCGLVAQCTEKPARAASDEELLLAHTERHVEEVKRLTREAEADPLNRELREPDGPGGVFYSPAAEAAARLACGCVIDAALEVLSHRAEGFCFFNSVAVAARCALESGRASRVAIVDYDVHHGNGTQAIFYNDPRVLYISLHRWSGPGGGWYPESGSMDEVGEGEGIGSTVNLPWPENDLGDTDYVAAFELVVLPILRAFAADLLLISAGFDAAEGDAQGRMRLTPAGFGTLTSMLVSQLDCAVAAALEGGYNVPVTSECCEAVLRVLLGEATEPPPTQRLHKCCEPMLRAVLRTQAVHWPCLRGREAIVDDYFRAAVTSGMPTRVSKRKR